MNHYPEASTNAKEVQKEYAREAIADEPTIDTARKLVVVGRESVFSQEIVDYALERAERMSYEIIALNTAPLSCETFKLFSSSRNKICEDFEDLSKKMSERFRKRPKKNIPFAHVVKFKESYGVLKELKNEIGEMALTQKALRALQNVNDSWLTISFFFMSLELFIRLRQNTLQALCPGMDGEANRVDLSRRSLDEGGGSQERRRVYRAIALRRRIGYDAILLNTQPLAAGCSIYL